MTAPAYPHDYYRRNNRRIWQSASSDFLHWTEPYPTLVPVDGFDGIDDCFYGGMQQAELGDVRLGFLNVFQYTQNRLSVQLVYSRNGSTWTRFNKGQTWLDRAEPGAWDSVMTTIENPAFEMGDEWFIYYGGASCHHDWWFVGLKEGLDVPEAKDMSLAKYAIGLLRMRKEGIVSMSACRVRQGILVTRPLISEGSQLVMNAKCGSRGSIQVEVADATDKMILGFGREQCDVFTGDAVNHVVTWRGHSHMSVHKGRARYPEPERERFRKFRFFLRGAEIFAIQMV